MSSSKSVFFEEGNVDQDIFAEKMMRKVGNADDRADMIRMGKIQELRVYHFVRPIPI